ncbi:hypothetical protein VCRA2110O135_200051 [Vibrio crassostreae]|nr:hypothetical protein VCRA2110O135_200051 [Vibrio crassostreae]
MVTPSVNFFILERLIPVRGWCVPLDSLDIDLLILEFYPLCLCS